jgi:cytochrome c oxidase assembly protein Cox11
VLLIHSRREVKEMNRKILFAVLALAIVLIATPYIGMAYAKPPTNALFYVPMEGFGGTSMEISQAGKSNNWIC